MPDVVIVGGGAIGCATAYFLARGGAKVTLLERNELAGEASGAAAGMLAALSDEGGDRGPDFQQLCIDSLNLYADLLPVLEATDIDLRYRRTGILHLALTEREASDLRRRYETQRQLAPEMRWIEGAEIAEEEPEANPNAVAAIVSPTEHYLDPQRLVLALAEAARREGATIMTDTPVRQLLHANRKMKGVRTEDATYRADAVILSAGPWTATMARKLGSYVPVRPMRGQMLALAGLGQPLRRIIFGEDNAYLVPRENNLTFVGATVEDIGFRKRNTVSAVRWLRTEAIKMVPGLAYARLASTWAGLRPGTPDALPILGLLPGWSNAWVATGHFRNGILLSPITGKLMAASIIAGKPLSQLAPFSPSRFQD